MSTSQCSQCSAIRSPPGKDPLDSVRVAASSPHYTLLNSNKPPLDEESRPVKSVISKIDEKLASLVDTMAPLRERLKQLEEEHASLSSYRAQNLAIISPLRRLPFEVLGEIFSWTLEPVSDARNRRIGFSPMYSPWVLTHISQHWRAVAISSPALWSLLMLIFDHPSSSYNYPMAMLETQLERAGNLKIHFYGSQSTKSQSQIDTFRYLAAHAARWEELSIELTSDLVPLLAPLQGRLPVLRRLSINWDEAETQTGVQSIDSFQSAPLLVDVAVYICSRLVSVPFPSNQLTCYALDAPWSVHGNLLAASPNLVQARVSISFDYEPWPPADTIIHLLCLRRLYVADPRILKHLHFPILEELGLTVGGGDGPAILECIQDALHRFPCPLQNLHFDGCPDAHSITEILKRLPLLKKLAITIDPETANETEAVMERLTDTAVAPKLRCLSFGCQDHSALVCNYSSYLQVVRSRWESPSCALKRTELLTAGRHDIDSDTADAIKVLREEGLVMVFLEGGQAAIAMFDWSFDHTWNWSAS